jgi:uncharacterized protein
MYSAAAAAGGSREFGKMINQYVPQDFCLHCQGCCRFNTSDSVWSPSVTSEDKARLERNKIPSFFISAQNKIRLIFNQQWDIYACSFLTSPDNKCKVYEYRPLECQIYPFVIHRNGSKVHLAVDK